MSYNTVTTGAVFIPEVWSQDFIRETNPRLVMANLVKRYDREIAKMGDTIHIPTITNLSANDKVAGLPVSPQAVTETEVLLTIDKHKETSFVIEDALKVQSDADLMREYTETAGIAQSEAVDDDLAVLAASLSQTFGTYNTAMTTDVILDSIEQLDLNDVPQDDRHFTFRPDVKRDLLDLATYTSKDYTSGDAVRTGLVGDLYGVATYMTTNMVKSGSNTNNMLFHRHAFALGMQKNPRVQSEYSLRDLGWLTVFDCMYGVKERRDNFGVLVKS